MGDVAALHLMLKRSNKPCWWLALLVAVFFLALAPRESLAYSFDSKTYLLDTVTGRTCPGPDCGDVLKNSAKHKVEVCPGKGLVRRIIPCIRSTILRGANDFLLPFSSFLASTVQVCCILAVIFWGVQMISGSETAPLKDGIVMALKIGFVVMFTMNFGGNSLDPANTHNGNFGLLLDIMDQMLVVVTGYVLNASRFGINGACSNYYDGYIVWQVWNAVDCAVDTLVGGIFSPLTLSTGVLGFILACMFSNTIGFTIGMILFYLIYKMLYAIYKCCHIFLTAYVGVAFVVIVSPLFIPMILFRGTKSYFDKWLQLLIGFMVQPMILFAYLAMLLAAFDTVVFAEKNQNSLYYAIAGKDPCFFKSTTTPCAGGPGGMGYGSNMGDWINLGGFYTEKDVGGQAIGIDAKKIRDDGLIPKQARDVGALGEMTQQMLSYAQVKREGSMKVLGIDGKNPRFFQISIPQRTVQWEKVARANDYDESSPEKSTTSYLLKLLVSAFMALITGYIFVEFLDIVPFVGNGMAMGGGLVEAKGLKGGMGMEKLTGGPGMMERTKFGAEGTSGASRL